MLTDDEYKAKLARVEQLMKTDPLFDSADGRELDALADELQEYEKAHFPFVAYTRAPRKVFTLKDMAEAGYIMGLSTIGEVATHMESHHHAYFNTEHFAAELREFENMIAGHEEDSIDVYLSEADKRQMDEELAQAMNEGPQAPTN